MNEEARLQLDSIVDRISRADRQAIASTPKENLVLLHHGFGTWIRNLIRSNEIGALSHWSRSEVPGGATHFDDLSGPIIRQVWEALRSLESGAVTAPRPESQGPKR